MRSPFYRRDPQAALVDLMMLRLDERGVLETVIDLYFVKNGKLNLLDERMPRSIGVEKRVWKRIYAALLQRGFLQEVEGCIYPGPMCRFIVTEPRQMPAEWALTRAAVIQRDGARCSYCADEAGPFDIDHVVPVVHGGSHALTNLVVACRTCNRSKGSKSVDAWLAENA